ncbi:hypothetical protein J3R73_004094 [Labrys monachus]|uniref:Uncharacterized protein n=1 Tax=Labrys monachus TaxID=217067 RepID=A0ABU0FI64_9HYPH|nr:hypothetical protein [Labrys monachus]
MASHVVQGRRRPFPARPGRANRQRAEARLSPIDPDQAFGLTPECRTGGIAGAGGHGSLHHQSCRTGLAPFTASGPGKPLGRASLTHGTGGTGALADGLYLRRTPPAGQPGPRAAAAADAAGRVCRPPASDKAIRPGRPAPLLSRAGSAAGPKAARSRHSSSSSPVYRPDGRVIAHPALPDVGGPGIAPGEDAMGRSAAIPFGAGPAMVSNTMTERTGASMRLARRRRTGIGRSGWKARGGIANLGPAALRSEGK